MGANANNWLFCDTAVDTLRRGTQTRTSQTYVLWNGAFFSPPFFFNKSGYWLIRLPINDYSADKGQTEAPRGKKKKRRDDNSWDKYELAWTHHSFVATQAFPVLLTQPGLTKIIIFFRIWHSNEHLYNHLHFFLTHGLTEIDGICCIYMTAKCAIWIRSKFDLAYSIIYYYI